MDCDAAKMERACRYCNDQKRKYFSVFRPPKSVTLLRCHVSSILLSVRTTKISTMRNVRSISTPLCIEYYRRKVEKWWSSYRCTLRGNHGQGESARRMPVQQRQDPSMVITRKTYSRSLDCYSDAVS